jgi:hypothetical protein
MKNRIQVYLLIRRGFLPEKFNLLSDILANADILLAFETLFEYIQYSLFSGIEPFPIDLTHLLQIHYTRYSSSHNKYIFGCYTDTGGKICIKEPVSYDGSQFCNRESLLHH